MSKSKVSNPNKHHANSPLTEGPAITVEDVLQLPRPSPALPNPSSTLALWPSTCFSFSGGDNKGRTEKSLSLVDLPRFSSTGEQLDLVHAEPRKVLGGLVYTEAAWLDDVTFLFLRPAGGEQTLEEEGRVDHPAALGDAVMKKRLAELSAQEGGEGVEVWAKDVVEGDEYLVGKLPVAVANLKIVRISSGKERGAVLAFSAKVFPDGDVDKVAEHKKKVETDARGSNVRVYDSLFVRHWDEWSPTAGELTQLHFVRLTRNPDSFTNSDGESSGDEFEHIEMPREGEMEGTEVEGRWTMVSKTAPGFKEKRPTVLSPMAGTPLECPVGSFGGPGDFSLSSTHLVFHSKDPLLNPAWHTRTQTYIVPLSPRSAADAKPKALTVGTQGATSSPVLSKDGKRVAWLEMREDGYEADRNRVMIYELATGKRWGATEKWDRSPTTVEWCPCGEKVYLLAEDEGHVKLFQLSVPLSPSASYAHPEPETLTHKHSITALSPLSNSSVLLTQNSLVTPNVLAILSLPTTSARSTDKGTPPPRVHLAPLATLTPHLAEQKELDGGESFWFPGAEGVEVNGFILFPPGFKEKSVREKSGKKWPLAFLVHGGPQGAWTDSWSTRWNPNVYAAHGYITVTINPTGSTGYGQKFTDDIKNQWGGKPFLDLVAGLEFVKEAFPEIDPERTAMLGASYGGFMANWIQGHNDVTKFKAIVCHDGVFSTSGTWFTTDELYFSEREFGGLPWEKPENFSRWDPQNHIKNWKTPQLVIHGGRDFRLTESEGLGVFNTLQRLGIPSRFVYFEKENHWVLEPHNGVRWHEEVFKWIDEWTAEDVEGKGE